MFGIFKKKSRTERLETQYQKLLAEAYNLSKINRKASDEKTAEAHKILAELETLETA